MNNKQIKMSLVAGFLIATNTYAAEQLSTITVTSATQSEQSIKDVTSNVNVITKEEIEERHYTNVAEALNSISGISITGNGTFGNDTSIYLRGNSTNRVLVLIDGIRYNDITSSDGAKFEHLMINDVEQIEVVKGAQSGVWGADASGGVINIITKGARIGMHGAASFEYGSYGTTKTGLNLSHKTERYTLQGSFSRILSNGFSAFEAKQSSVDYGKRGDELGRERDGYENSTGALKLEYHLDESNKLNLSHRVISATTNYDNPSSDTTKSYTTHDNFSTLAFQNSNKFATTTLNVNRSVFDRDYNSGSTKEYDGNVNEYGIKSNIPYMNKKSFVLIGANKKKFGHTNGINETFKNKAFFITNSNKFNDDNTIITESFRIDKYDKFDNKNTGKVGVKHFFTQDLYLSSNYGTAYNVPTLYNLYSSAYGNSQLKPETTKGYDLQLGYKDFSVTYFNTKIKDMIEYDFGTSKFGNVNGESTLKGYELEYTKEVLSQTLLNLNYTHLSARDENNQPLRRVVKRELKFAVDYYGISQFHFNVNGSYVGSRYDDANSTIQTGRYTLWNAAMNYEIDKNLNAYVKIDNIFDKYYQTANGYATAGQSAYVGLKASF